MFYIFNSEHVCVGSCNAEPNQDDLASRGEYTVDYDGECGIGFFNNCGEMVKPVKPEPTTEELAAQVRVKRDYLLSRFDSNLYRNQFYWETLTQVQRDERLAYRQALLDLTLQAGFPTVIDWPSAPPVD